MRDRSLLFTTIFALVASLFAGVPVQPALAAGSLDHLVLAPASQTIAPNAPATYTVEGFDSANVSLGPVTDALLAIAPDGTCTLYDCTATTAGIHTVTATKGTVTGTATLTVSGAWVQRADAVVLVNSAAADAYQGDYVQNLKLLLDHYGIPYTVIDISTQPVPNTIGEYAVIVVAQHDLDLTGAYLDATEQATIATAVHAGTGLVSFDYTLSSATPHYGFVDAVFRFGYDGATSGSGVTIPSNSHYITALHSAGWSIGGGVTLPGITLPTGATALATSGGAPYLSVTTYGAGRAVQFGSYDPAPLYGMDDLFWRSAVWAARKPFVMQGMPPFVTMRVDDVQEPYPFDWVHLANEVGLKPWVGFNIGNISDADAADLSGLVNSGNATAAIHGQGNISFFYGQSPSGGDFDPATWQANFDWGTQWMKDHNIPFSKYILPQYYVFGTNNFSGTADVAKWGVEFLGTLMPPGQGYPGGPVLPLGPFDTYGVRGPNFTYADFMTITNHPELNGKYFDCVTEIRSDQGYEWYPTVGSPAAVASTIGHGTYELKMALDAMSLATLFTHGFSSIDVPAHQYPDDYRAVFHGIMDNLRSYNMIPVTMDYACQYLRATKTGPIKSATYDPATKLVTANFTGHTDMTTKFYVFTDGGGQFLADAPQFTTTGAETFPVSFTAPGPLAHIAVAPAPGSLVAGGTLQFTATAYDADGNPIPTQLFTWSVVNGGGSINADGLFTAGNTAGSFAGTVVASIGGVHAAASVEVTAPVMAHFTIAPIASPAYVGAQFTTTITARTASEGLVVTYNGPVDLAVSAGTVSPSSVTLTNGTWTGPLTMRGTPSTGLTLSVTDGTYTGTSNAFDLATIPPGPYTIWGATPATGLLGAPAGGNAPVELGVRFRSAIDAVVTGVRFWKDPQNTGAHLGHLWTNGGTLLATVTFTGETASGWQEARFDQPVSIMAGTTYVISYHTNYFTYQANYFASTGHDAPPLRALAGGEAGGNGIYLYDSEGTGALPYFPSKTAPTGEAASPNYWVDVIVEGAGQNPLDHIVVSPSTATLFTESTQQFTATAYYADGSEVANPQISWAVVGGGAIDSHGLYTAPLAAGTAHVVASLGGVQGTAAVDVQARTLDHFTIATVATPEYAGAAFAVSATARDSSGHLVADYSGDATLAASAGTVSPPTAHFSGGTWTASVTIPATASGITLRLADGAATGMTNAFDVIALPRGPFTIFGIAPVSAPLSTPTTMGPVELGVRFRSATAARVTGLRFWKDAQNTGTQVGHLWSNTGTLLATATFTNETGSGWQEVRFGVPVDMVAGATYVASYRNETGLFNYTAGYFTSAGHDSPPLRALKDGEDGSNSVYLYDQDLGVTGSPPTSRPRPTVGPTTGST